MALLGQPLFTETLVRYLGVAAMILGTRGHKHADLNPEARGKCPAWTGIILCGLCAVGYTLLIVNTMMMGAFN